jgi:outer membrane lipoprotein-sorting protein
MSEAHSGSMTKKVSLPLLAVMSAFLAIGASADELVPVNPVGAVMWAGATFVPQNLGSLKLDEKTYAKITQYPRGLAFQSNGDLLATLGNGTTPLMEITKWTGTTTSTLVKFQWHDYTADDFKSADKMKELAEGETHGAFWFFGGPLAVDGKNQVYFNLGACGPNGLYQLLQVDPIKVQMLFPSEGFQALQFYPQGSNDLYATTFSAINKMEQVASKSSGTSAPIFSMLDSQAHLLHTLLLDQDHLLATLILSQPATGEGGQKTRPPPKFMAVVFDRKQKGYYLFDIKQWGPMAIRPTDNALFRFDADAKEIRQFTLPSFASDDSSPSATASRPPDSGPGSAQAALTPGEIFEKAREAYAALTSYSDQGTVIATLNGLTITTTFKIKLARPNLYRIDWLQTNDSPFSIPAKPQSVWSDGTGDFLDMLGQGPQKQASQEMALGGATGISGGAAATIPSEFFKTNWGDRLGAATRNDKQQPDEKIGDTDCYVFSGSIKGNTSTIWIGKQDFLIRQVRTLTSAAAMKAVIDEAAKVDPGAAAHIPAIPPHDLTSTETHTNLVLNPKLAPPDFAH